MSVGYPKDAQPSIQWKHIDGPLLSCRNGSIHWLTLWERIQLRFGRTDLCRLERKHWSKP